MGAQSAQAPGEEVLAPRWRVQHLGGCRGGRSSPSLTCWGLQGPSSCFPQVETRGSTERRCTERERHPEEGG